MDPEFARQTRIWFPEPSFRKSRKILALPREEFSRVIRWLTGHAFLRLQNFRADSSVTPMSVCRYCSRRPERASHHAEVREAQTAEGGVLRSLGPDQDTPPVGSEPSAGKRSSCWLVQKS